MNRLMTGLLATAVALVFSGLVYYTGVTLVPAVQPTGYTNEYAPPPQYPNQPDVTQCYVGTGVTEGSNEPADTYQTLVRPCIQQLEEQNRVAMQRYAAEQRQYDREQATAEKVSAAAIDAEGTRSAYRSLIAIALSLAGLLLILVFIKVPALVYGFAGGSAVSLFVATTALMTGSQGATQVRGAGIILAFFVLSLMMIGYERRFRRDTASK